MKTATVVNVLNIYFPVIFFSGNGNGKSLSYAVDKHMTSKNFLSVIKSTEIELQFKVISYI